MPKMTMHKELDMLPEEVEVLRKQKVLEGKKRSSRREKRNHIDRLNKRK
jgi:hypothetical protein